MPYTCIEPGATGQDHVTFVVPRSCKAVQIRLLVQPGQDGHRGWRGIAYHDTGAGAPR